DAPPQLCLFQQGRTSSAVFVPTRMHLLSCVCSNKDAPPQLCLFQQGRTSSAVPTRTHLLSCICSNKDAPPQLCLFQQGFISSAVCSNKDSSPQLCLFQEFDACSCPRQSGNPRQDYITVSGHDNYLTCKINNKKGSFGALKSTVTSCCVLNYYFYYYCYYVSHC
ncbi:hypothetical protein OTU49_010910, partial [Cherax quadricarinatus]